MCARVELQHVVIVVVVGFGGPSVVQKFTDAQRQQALPTAATCFITLYLPPVEDAAAMRRTLLEAVANRDAGFHEGAVAQ